MKGISGGALEHGLVEPTWQWQAVEQREIIRATGCIERKTLVACPGLAGNDRRNAHIGKLNTHLCAVYDGSIGSLGERVGVDTHVRWNHKDVGRKGREGTSKFRHHSLS